MTIDYARAVALRRDNRSFSYSVKDTILYAIGIGLGSDPLDTRELRFVYEKNLLAMPTLATVIAWGADALAETGIDFTKVVQGEQRLTIHRPLPAAGDILADWAVDEIVDKGAGKGALIIHHFDIRLRDSGEKLATLGRTTFARGDGGFGGPAEGGPAPHPIPDRAPDREIAITTPPGLGLLYRLNGDWNPLHADPDVARAAGFPRPILHGMCTYGVACRAVLDAWCDFDPTRLCAFDVRFSSPVYPGDRIVTRMWRDGDTISFEAGVPDRDVMVLRNGRAVITS